MLRSLFTGAFLCLLAAGLAGCGQKGPLYLPVTPPRVIPPMPKAATHPRPAAATRTVPASTRAVVPVRSRIPD